MAGQQTLNLQLRSEERVDRVFFRDVPVIYNPVKRPGKR